MAGRDANKKRGGRMDKKISYETIKRNKVLDEFIKKEKEGENKD